ncbi:hypothetical protein Aph01nite_74020 [Acrocarpospora phusangensis]|uniref:Uncharacterized protein n=1 Tax=Acrocarpospora phusangensis TaxID=1070424 RepID=A0A919QHK9_9ACTN|nr:hypothetical protein [Acrocarpospora phusangensis]GIH29092.1 hypothetical protein Aph01nite_74020 [Acrocarpospora phusangensis]
MEPGEIRKALADAVRTPIPSLNCFGFVPDVVPPPAFYAGEVEIDFDKTFGRGMDEIQVTCRLLVSRADDRSGQALLDKYLAGSGEYSVKAALMAARGAPGEPALGGLADDLHLRRVQGYRLYQVGEVQFYGAELIVHVYGRG